MKFQHNDGGRAAAGFKGETGDCATRAIAIATGLPYQTVYDAINLRAKSERVGKRMRGRSSARTGVHKELFKRYLASLGWTWVPCMAIGQGCTVHLRDGEIPMTGAIIALVSKHYVAVIDGVIHDTSDPSREGNRCVYGYFTKAS